MYQSNFTDTEKEYWEYEKQINETKKEMVSLEEKQTQEKEKQVELAKQIADKQKQLADLSSQMTDRNKFTVDELVGLPSQGIQPWTRTGARNIAAAQQVKNLEGWARRFTLEGMTDRAEKVQAEADRLRKTGAGILTALEQDPTQKITEAMRETKNEIAKLNAKEEGGGIKMRATMGR